jgi:hypothetical protein
MLASFLYRLSVGLYYLLLGLWAGGLATFALAAPSIFYRMRVYQPEATRTPAGVGNLDGPDAQLIAGDIANHILENLATVQIVAAAALVVLVVLQCTAFRRWLRCGAGGKANVLRSALLAVAVMLVAVQLGYVSPRMGELRGQMYSPDAAASARQAARQQFETYHTFSERTLGGVLLLLAGTTLVSPFALNGPASAQRERSV